MRPAFQAVSWGNLESGGSKSNTAYHSLVGSYKIFALFTAAMLITQIMILAHYPLYNFSFAVPFIVSMLTGGNVDK